MSEQIFNAQHGVLSLLNEDLAASPQATLPEVVRRCPVASSLLSGSPILSRYEDVIWALRSPDLFSSDIDASLGFDRKLIPQQIDPPAHTEYRRILDPLFSRRRIAEFEPRLAAHAHDLIDKCLSKGECDYSRDFAVPFTCTAFLEIMGFPLSDLRALLRLKDNVIRPNARDFAESTEFRAQAIAALCDYFEKLVDQADTAPDGVLKELACTDFDGRKLSRDEVVDICRPAAAPRALEPASWAWFGVSRWRLPVDLGK